MLVQSFEIEHKGEKVNVREFRLAKQQVFRVELKFPLAITKALGQQGSTFWTSIPEGRQVEAEEIGLIIENYVNKK